jgi:hypothetical protein
MLYQVLNESGDDMGLLKVVECHSEKFNPYQYEEIIKKSCELFKEIGEDEGFDPDDLDDFVTFHNLRSVLILERIYVEGEINFY